RGRNQISGLVAVDRAKKQIRLGFLSVNDLRIEVIDLSCLRREMREPRGMPAKGLYVLTDMMLSRLHRHSEIGAILVRSHPRSIDSDVGRRGEGIRAFFLDE